MAELAKKIGAILGLVGIIFGVYFFIDETYAEKKMVSAKFEQLASKVDSTDLGLKIIILQSILEKKRMQLSEARDSGSQALVESLENDIEDIKRRISLLEEKALN